MALWENLTAPDVVVVRGPVKDLDAWRSALASAFLPNALTLFVPNGTPDLPAVTTLEALFKLVAASPSGSETPA